MNAELWAKVSSDSISANSHGMKLVYHDWDRFEYPENHIRVLDQADDPYLRTALRAGQGIDLQTFLISSFQVLDGARGDS